MRIAHAVSSIDSYGENDRLAGLIRGLSDRFDFDVIAPRESPLFDMLSGARVKLSPMDIAAGKSIMLRDVYKIREHFRLCPPDAVHTHASLSARLAARMCGIKNLISERTGSGGGWRRGSLSSILYNLVTVLTVSSSESVTEQLLRQGVPRERIVSIGCAFPVSGVCDSVLPSWNNGDGGSDFLSGEPCRRGRFSVIAECRDTSEVSDLTFATTMCMPAFPMSVSIFCAEDILARAERVVASRGLCGSVSVRPLWEIRLASPRDTDIFVYPSADDDRLPLSALAFMSYGVPVLAADTTRSRDFLTEGRSALFFSPGDPFSLADKISLLLCDDGFRDFLSRGAISEWTRRFTAERMLRGYESLYLSFAEDIST